MKNILLITIRFIEIVVLIIAVTLTISSVARAQTPAEPMVSAGGTHTVGLRSNGTVIAIGQNDDGRCNVTGWSEIVQVAAGRYHTVGLKSDGAVVAVGSNDYGQCNVTSWSGIIQVATGGKHTVGLKSDGTVVAVGKNDDNRCSVTAWDDIVQVAAGDSYTVGLKADGTMVAVGSNDFGQCNVSGKSGIIQITAGDSHVLGLRSDGTVTVVAVGSNIYGQSNVSGWNGFVQLSAGLSHTIGLKSNGAVFAIGRNDSGQCNVSDWSSIVQVSAGGYHTVGLKADGTVMATGANEYEQCNINTWDLDSATQLSTVMPSTLGALSPTSSGAIAWISEWDAALSKALIEDKPIMVNFYTDSCALCKNLDQDTFNNSDVVGFVNANFLPVRSNPSKSSLYQSFNISGVPTIVFITPDGGEMGRITGYKTSAEFLQQAQQALETTPIHKYTLDTLTDVSRLASPPLTPGTTSSPPFYIWVAIFAGVCGAFGGGGWYWRKRRAERAWLEREKAEIIEMIERAIRGDRK